MVALWFGHPSSVQVLVEPSDIQPEPVDETQRLLIWVDELRHALRLRDDRILHLEVELEATRRQRDLARQELRRPVVNQVHTDT